MTIVEVLCVVTILIVLMQLALPAYRKVQYKAESTACASNLRQLGISVELAAQDNEGNFPYIETDPNDPVYQPEYLPEGVEPKSLLDTLEPYGIHEVNLRCPADVKKNNRFKELGSSYEWRPMLDGESSLAPEYYSRRGVRQVNPSKFRIIIDVDPVHGGRQNSLYADGHVKSY